MEAQVNNKVMIKNSLMIAYGLFVLIPIATWVKGSGWEGDVWYGLMRLAGLVAFTLMAGQLFIGAVMNKLRPWFGMRLLKFHIVQGIVAFVLAWAHPVFLAVNFGISGVLNLPGYATWGRLALLLLTLGVLAGLLRTSPLIMKHWRWVHRLNYLVFAMVYVHSWNLGSDVRMFPMTLIYWISPVLFFYSLYYKLMSFAAIKKEKTQVVR